MASSISIQERILAGARKNKIPVTVFLMNGFRMTGAIIGYDSFSVAIMEDGNQKLVYKHAISTVQPSKPIDLRLESEE